MEESLAQRVEFRLDAVKQIYAETATYIPAELLRDYESLVMFNKKLTHERNVLLRRQMKTLEAEVRDMRAELDQLNGKRVEYMRILHSVDTFKKFEASSEAPKWAGRSVDLYGESDRTTGTCSTDFSRNMDS